MSKTFEQHLTIFGDSLEDNPDPWFNNPKGWLRKPDYKRPAQEKANIGNPGAQAFSLANILNSGYKMRWFVLDMTKKRLIYYKNNQSGTPESGLVEMKYILDVQPSQVFDAPEFAIDLISAERHYTLVAADHNSMIRWAFAFNLVIAKNSSKKQSSKPAPKPKPTGPLVVQEISAVKWFRYDVIYEDPGPLMVNVMGLANRDRNGKVLNNWIIVTSFENHPDGRPGRSELSGMIAVKDYIVGVNGLDLTTYTFNDAMDAVVAATWPKTIHFLRDNHASREANRAECWAFVYYPSLNRRRRRYIELQADCINFRKPAPGGSASGKRDSYLTLNKIAQIRPVIDMNLPADQQYVLHLICKQNATVEMVDDNDTSLGGAPVDVLELCFAKQSQMNAWRSALVSPVGGVGESQTPIPVLPVETVEAVQVSSSTTLTRLGVKSNLTGRFALREFTISEGSLRWKRPKGSKSIGKERSMFIANSGNCGLRNCRAIYDPLEEKTGFKYQIVLQNTEQQVVMGMPDEETMTRWLNIIRDVVAISPGAMVIIIPNSAETGSSSSADDDFYDTEDNQYSGDSTVVQGYLFKKGERVAPGIGSENFRKRWFVLKDFSLFYFKSAADSRAGETLSLGSMDLRSAIEVREALGYDSPENGIEIVTPTRVYLLVAEDEDDQLRWLDALGDTLETRVMATREVETGAAAASKAQESVSERIANKTKAIIYSGQLSMRSVNRITSMVTWKDRFFVIANGSITYYDYRDDYFDEDKDCLGEIALMSIISVETSVDPKCQPGCAFDVQAHVLRGGDANGMRIFTLNCRSVNECKEWMSQICTANGTLELRMKGTNPAMGLRSFVNESAVKLREQSKRRGSAMFANAATIQKVQSTSDGYNAGVAVQEAAKGEEEDLTEEEANKRKLNAMSQRHRGSVLAQPTAGGAGRGFGGRGRGISSRSSATEAQMAAAINEMNIGSPLPAPPSDIPSTPGAPLVASETNTPATTEYQDDDADEDVEAAVISQGAVVAATTSRRGPLLAVGGRGRGAGRGAGFQAASANRRGSAIASGNM